MKNIKRKQKTLSKQKWPIGTGHWRKKTVCLVVCFFFFISYWNDHMIFKSYLYELVNLLTYMLNHPCISSKNTTWMWWVIFLIYSYSCSCIYENFAPMFIRDIALYFLFCLSCLFYLKYYCIHGRSLGVLSLLCIYKLRITVCRFSLKVI